MMGRIYKLLLLLVVFSCAGGCVVSNPPSITYIQLTAGEVLPGDSSTPRVFVDSIQVPDYLLRNELLLRTSEHGLRYESDVRWAEPVDVGVQRVLALRLSAALDSYAVISFPAAHNGKLDWRVDIALRHFEAMNDEARLIADIQLYPKDGDSAFSEQFKATQPLSKSSGTAIAATLSDLLEQLAEHVAARMLDTTPESE